MHRFFLPPDQCRNAVLELTDREVKHAVQVLRVAHGERITVLDGAGNELLCDVLNVGKRAVRLTVQHRHHTPRPPCPVTLFQAIPKGRVMDVIVQKATELGAARVVPIVTERVVAHLDGEGAEHKAEKWRAIAIESIKQCGSSWLPDIATPLTLQQQLARRETFDLSLIASLQEDSRHPRARFRDFESTHKRKPASVGVWVGPEGDFSPAEMNTIKAEGALPITLGPLVLRSDTAAIYSLSVLNYELQS